MTMPTRGFQPGARRGAAAVVTIIMLLLVNLIVVGMVVGGARESDLTMRRVETVQAFYAAEGGMNMALRELMENSDEDGDGAVGSISDDADDSNNPALGMATMLVTLVDNSGETTVTSAGVAGAAHRTLEVVLSGSASSSIGLSAKYFDHDKDYLTALSQLDWDATPAATGTAMSLNIASTTGSFWSGGPTNYFGVQYDGDITIASAGTWTFYTESDDGSALWIDGAQIVDNDGAHGMVERSGTVSLTAGTHVIRVRFIENSGGAGLIVRWAGPSGTPAKQVIPSTAFAH